MGEGWGGVGEGVRRAEDKGSAWLGSGRKDCKLGGNRMEPLMPT